MDMVAIFEYWMKCRPKNRKSVGPKTTVPSLYLLSISRTNFCAACFSLAISTSSAIRIAARFRSPLFLIKNSCGTHRDCVKPRLKNKWSQCSCHLALALTSPYAEVNKSRRLDLRRHSRGGIWSRNKNWQQFMPKSSTSIQYRLYTIQLWASYFPVFWSIHWLNCEYQNGGCMKLFDLKSWWHCASVVLAIWIV